MGGLCIGRPGKEGFLNWILKVAGLVCRAHLKSCAAVWTEAPEEVTQVLLAIGYGKDHLPYRPNETANRLPLNELVFDEDLKHPFDLEKLASWGIEDLFYYVRNAPSTYNRQPWRFVIREGKVWLAMESFKEENEYFDAGIVMFLFEGLAADDNYVGKWKLEPIHEEHGAHFIATYHL